MTDIANVLDSRGADWRAWLVDNLRSGCDPVDMHGQMRAAGWTDVLAEQALLAAAAEVFPHLAADALPVPRVPGLGAVDCGDCLVNVTVSLLHPAVALCENVVSDEECRELIAYARHRGMLHNTVVDEATGQEIPHPERTSAGLMLHRGETDLVARIEARLAALTGWPIANGEGLQILRYGVGDEYRPHFDSFPEGVGGAKHIAGGGQRVNTVLVYLQLAEEGGATSFPAAGLALRPKTGEAIVFCNVDRAGQREPASLHAGLPVGRGEKIVMTYWQRAFAIG